MASGSRSDNEPLVARAVDVAKLTTPADGKTTTTLIPSFDNSPVPEFQFPLNQDRPAFRLVCSLAISVGPEPPKTSSKFSPGLYVGRVDFRRGIRQLP
jgi:hypothetical protein